MDAGWTNTIDEYFNYFKTWLEGSVKEIFTNVVNCLVVNIERRFVTAEMKYFSMWFYLQNNQMKDQVRQLVREGRLEIIQGGWTAPDEACPNYEDIITNMYLGHKFMLKEFGVTSKIGWQIDAFGHSSAHAALLTDFGFEALFFTRMENRTREELQL